MKGAGKGCSSDMGDPQIFMIIGMDKIFRLIHLPDNDRLHFMGMRSLGIETNTIDDIDQQLFFINAIGVRRSYRKKFAQEKFRSYTATLEYYLGLYSFQEAHQFQIRFPEL